MTRAISKQMAKPVPPAWFVQLEALAKDAATGSKARGSPEVLAFSNMCRHQKRFGNLVHWELLPVAGTTVMWACWTARDPRWSGKK